MFFFSLEPTSAKTVADATRAWSDAVSAWSQVAAHVGSAAQRATAADAPASPLEAGADMVKWSEEYALLAFRAWRETAEALAAGLAALPAAGNGAFERNPFGVTGLFTSALPTNASPLSVAVEEAEMLARPRATKPTANKTKPDAATAATAKSVVTAPATAKSSASKAAPKPTKPAKPAKPAAESTATSPAKRPAQVHVETTAGATKKDAAAQGAKTSAEKTGPVKSAPVKAKPTKSAAAPKNQATEKAPSAKSIAKLQAPISAIGKTKSSKKKAKAVSSATPDDLTKIKGIGPKIEDALHSQGIFHYWQIAQLTKAEAEQIEARINYPGRIKRQKWTEQAEALLSHA